MALLLSDKLTRSHESHREESDRDKIRRNFIRSCYAHQTTGSKVTLERISKTRVLLYSRNVEIKLQAFHLSSYEFALLLLIIFVDVQFHKGASLIRNI